MEKILIKNFKAIQNNKEVAIPVKNLLLMIGDNASGKSTVATLIYFFKSLKDEVFDLVLNNDFTKDNFYSKLTGKLKSYLIKLFGLSESSFEITYYYENYYIKVNQNGGYNIGIERVLLHHLERICLNLKNRLRQSDNDIGDSSSQKERQIAIRIFYDELNQLFGNEETLYFLPNRNITVTLENRLLPIYSQLENAILSGKDEYVSTSDLLLLRLINYLDKTLIPKFKRRGGFRQLLVAEDVDSKLSPAEVNDFQKIINHIEQMLRGKYVTDEEGEKIVFDATNFHAFIYLTEASSGQKEVIRILQDFFWSALQNKSVLRIVDEPEIHLFPIRQKEFVEICAWLINANQQNKIILPTHSPYILTALNNCLYAGNIAKTKPDEVEKVVPKHFWLTSEQVAAFMLKDGEFESLIDEDSETKLIEASRIDEVSQILNDVLDQLITIDNA
jgi:predicted ATPase